ncbi:MAG: VCBS repeat-containing protein [Saprospiraceae bacterium]
MYFKNPAWLVLFLLFAACSNNDTQQPETNENSDTQELRFELLTKDQTGIDYQNIITETYETNVTNNLNIYNGGGVGILDVNQDGLQDLFLVSSQQSNKLYLNKGDFKFEDISQSAGIEAPGGLKTGVVITDINGDGWHDIFVCRAGKDPSPMRRNLLFVNQKDNTFKEMGETYGIADISSTNGANFFDYDLDGDLDIYLLNYPNDFRWASQVDLVYENGKPKANLQPRTEYDSDRLYRNNGNGTFTDVSQEAGIWNFSFGLSVTVSDFNEDGYPDLYVGNDFIQPDYLYINNRNGTFTDELDKYFKHISSSTMGVDVADFNNDGLVDVISNDMQSKDNFRQKTIFNAMQYTRYNQLVTYGLKHQIARNHLQINNGNGSFSEIGCLANVYDTDWSWAALLEDFDNDAHKDLYISNGYPRDIDSDFMVYTFSKLKAKGGLNKENVPDIVKFLDEMPSTRMSSYMFKNDGNLKFEDKSGKWLESPPAFSNGAAYADFDNDGDMDLIVNNIADPIFVYKNLTSEKEQKNYLQLKFKGKDQNKLAVGTKVRIQYGSDGLQYEELTPTRGFLSSVQYLLHFGLGDVDVVNKVEVKWPDGKVTTLNDVKANQVLELDYEKDAVVGNWEPIAGDQAIFAEKQIESDNIFTHYENAFADFDHFRLWPHEESKLGPQIATGDVNGDGLEDFFVGNAILQAPVLFIQKSNGTFDKQVWSNEANFEDQEAVFFDADGDGDQDLAVASGGYETSNPAVWTPRLYINDGKGNFSRDNEGIKDVIVCGFAIHAFDYDQDGDQDLIIGGRITPGNYPETPLSYVLQNNGGKFTDITDKIGKAFQQIGMVTDINSGDINGDGKDEMIMVGEWMPVSVFSFDGNQFNNISESMGLENTSGWWDCITLADLDKDGDLDMLGGNVGTNNRLNASVDQPLMMFANDYDNNGTIDPIMAKYYNDGKLYPLPQKDAIIGQIPILKKKYVYFADYAKATIYDVFSKEQLDAAIVLNVKTTESSIFINNGDSFIRKALPALAQIAPIKQILVRDFTGDGNLDVLTCGNDYGTDVETGRYDASNGTLLQGDGKGNFKPIPNRHHSFWASREARDMAILNRGNQKPLVVVANNSDRLQYFEIK